MRSGGTTAMTGKEDLFTAVHKGFRAMLYDLSARIQTNDFADLASTKQLAVDLEIDFATAQSAGCMLCAFAYHAEEENAVVFGPSARVADALVRELIQEHHEFTRRELELGKGVRDLMKLPEASDRVAAGIELNQKANELFAAYLVHMNKEETELVPIMRAHFSDAEQAAMRGQIIARFPPDRLFALLGWMLPSMNVTDLTEFLTVVKGAAPPPVMKRVADLAAARVDPARWATAKLRVGI